VKSSKYIVSDVLWQIAFKATNFAGVSLITTRKTMIPYEPSYRCYAI